MARLEEQLDKKIEQDVIEELKQEGNHVVEVTLSEQVTELKSELEAKKQTEKAHASKVSQL